MRQVNDFLKLDFEKLNRYAEKLIEENPDNASSYSYEDSSENVPEIVQSNPVNLSAVSQPSMVSPVVAMYPMGEYHQTDMAQVHEGDGFIYIDSHTYQSMVTQYGFSSQLPKHDQIIIGYFCIRFAKKYPLEVGYKDTYLIEINGIAGRDTEFTITIMQSQFEKNQALSVFQKSGLSQYISLKQLSVVKNALTAYISQKMSVSNPGVCIPYRAGFFRRNDTLQFAEKETPHTKHSKVIQNRSFPMKNTGLIHEAIQNFTVLMSYCKDVFSNALLHVARLTGLLTYVWHEMQIRQDRILSVNGTIDEMHTYLQVYGRSENCRYTCQLEQSEGNLCKEIFERKDEVMLIADKSAQPIAQQLNNVQKTKAKEALNMLYRVFVKGESYDVNGAISSQYAACTCAIISGYGDQMLPSSCIIPVTVPKTKAYSLRQMTQIHEDFDRVIVNEVLHAPDRIKEKLKEQYQMYSMNYAVPKEQSNVYAMWMAVFHLMQEICQQLPLSELEFSTKLEQMLQAQINSSDEDYLVQQVRKQLCHVIQNGEAEVIHDHKLFTVLRQSTVPVIYEKEQTLYIRNENFVKLVSEKIPGKISDLEVKKALKQAGYLLTDEDGYEVKRKLTLVSGQMRYLAIPTDILTEEAKAFLPYHYSTFVPCQDDGAIFRIPLGTDERGKTVYLGHPYLDHYSMLITGGPGSGKSIFAFRLMQNLRKLDQHAVYIDAAGIYTGNNLKKLGADDAYIEQYIRQVRMSDCFAVENPQSRIAEVMSACTGKIVIFQIDSDLEEANRHYAVDQLLRQLTLWCEQEEERTLFVTIDEAQQCNLKKESAIKWVLEQKRKSGMSLILIAPVLTGVDAKSRTTLTTTIFKVSFQCVNEKEAELAARNFGKGNVTELTRQLETLDKLTCMVSGPFEQADGNLRNGLIRLSVKNNKI